MKKSRLVSTAVCLAAALRLGSPTASRAEETIAARLDSITDELFALGMAPGLAVSVVNGGELVYSRGLGVADLDSGRPVTPETLFYIASATKPFTALAVALLDHEGVMELEAPITRYLPELELGPPLAADEITLRDLLTMTHGIENGGPVVFRTAFSGEFTRAMLLELLAGYGPAETGRAFSYGNLGYNIAGLAVEAATGRSWKEVVDGKVLAPLGMTSTSAWRSRVDAARLAMPHAPSPDGFRRLPYTKDDANMHAAGGHVTTVLDLARWLEAQLNQGVVDGERVFPAAVIAETHRQQAEQDKQIGPFHRHGWGLGWDLATYDGELMLHRFGSYAGFRPHVSFLPERGLGVAVLANDEALGGMLVDLVASAIYDELLDKGDAAERRAAVGRQTAERVAMGRQHLARELERRAARQTGLTRPLAAYTGDFANPELGRMKWRLIDGRLETRIGLARSEAEIYDAEVDQLRVELTGGGQVVRFTFTDGRATSLTYGDRVFTRTSG